MRVYIRDIREDIQEIKTSVKEIRPEANGEVGRVWQPVVVEMIKLVALCVTILGGIVGAVKLLGK